MKIKEQLKMKIKEQLKNFTEDEFVKELIRQTEQQKT